MMKTDFLELKKTVSGISDFRASRSLFIEEERVDDHPFSTGFSEAEMIESGGKLVADLRPLVFSRVYFLDGVQRTILLGHCNGYPLFLHFSGVAVVGRDGKDLSPFGEPGFNVCFITHKNVSFQSAIPVEIVDDDNFNNTGIFTQRSAFLRNALEHDFFRKVVKFVGGDELLVYDGPLFHSEGLGGANVIGIIKRHAVFYLPELKSVYGLNVGERSPAFILRHGSESSGFSVVSFYLRLFKSGDPYYGVVRVEVPRALAGSSDMIDSIASFVFSERFPISSSVHQADKKLYPISVCEKYLSSRMPSVDLLSAFLSDVV